FLVSVFVCPGVALESKSLSGKASPLWGFGPAANSPGQHGAYFKTRVTILNPTNFSYSIAATLHNGFGRVQTVLIPMGASQYHTWDNFLDEVFGYVGAGVVDLDSAYTPQNGSPSYIFTVAAEVYTESSS